MRIEVGAVTDVGKVRERNEDSYLVEPPIYAVADGMGGHLGGEVASQLALETIEELSQAGKGTLVDQVREANRVVFERSVTDRDVAGMGTTLTLVVVGDEAVHLAHVGDSRAYLLRAGALRRLTDDHTLVNRMVKAGEISAAEAQEHPHRNVLTRALGTEPDVKVDEESVALIDADRLLLCSDGLTGMVTEDQIQAILETTASPQEAAERLVRTANRAGGIDNITVVILDVHEDGPAQAGAPTSVDAGSAVAKPRSRERRARPSRATLVRWGIRAAVAVVVLAAVVVAGRSYLDRQWYVGEANGHVAVYQGIPAEVAGFDLSHIELETDIRAADVQDLTLYGDLGQGITATDRDEALAIVEQIRSDVRSAQGTQGPTAS